jgi:D-alanyl-D-alanine endopeptidase (penicillin-binding protein 7)
MDSTQGSLRLLPVLMAVLALLMLAATASPAQSAERVSKKAVEARKKAEQRSAARPAARAVPRRTVAAKPRARKLAETRKTGQIRKITEARKATRVSRATVPTRSASARISSKTAHQVSAGSARAKVKGQRTPPASLAAKAGAAGLLPIVPIAHIPSLQPSASGAIGLHEGYDRLALHSSMALMLDGETGRVLFEKNANTVSPIASITKLMTAMVVLDAGLPLDELIEITREDLDTLRGTGSRLRFGTVLTRDEMLRLALMSSENRAANALGRHYPGGLSAFVARMNAKARELGMTRTRFVEPTGLSARNVSTAYDLARLVRAASRYPLIREHSTAAALTVTAGRRQVAYRNSNRLIRNPSWEIGLQKTGYISEAGNCLVMQADIEGRPMVLVLLDADGKLSRFGDAQRLRDWFESAPRFLGDAHASVQPAHGS